MYATVASIAKSLNILGRIKMAKTVFIIQNLYLKNTIIQKATLEIDPPSIGINDSALTLTANSYGAITVDFKGRFSSPGRHNVRVTAPKASMLPVGPRIKGQPHKGGKNPANQTDIYRIFEFTITLNSVGDVTAMAAPGNQKKNGSVSRNSSNNKITIELQPVWMGSPNTRPRGGAEIDHVIVHHTADGQMSSSLHEMVKKVQPKSAHYLIDARGQVVKLMDEKDAACHVGPASWRGKSNIQARSIGIEVRHQDSGGNFTPQQYTALIDLLDQLIMTYPCIQRRNIIGHSDVAVNRQSRILGRKPVCPGPKFQWEILEKANFGLIPDDKFSGAAPSYIKFFGQHRGAYFRKNDDDAKQIYSGTQKTYITDAPIIKIQQDLANIGYATGKPDGQYGARTEAAVKAFQSHFFTGTRTGPKNGSVDNNTANMINRVSRNRLAEEIGIL